MKPSQSLSRSCSASQSSRTVRPASAGPSPLVLRTRNDCRSFSSARKRASRLRLRALAMASRSEPASLLEVPLPVEVAGDRQQGLPVFVAPLIDGPVEEGLEHPLERREQGRAENDGQDAENDGVEPVLGEDAGPGADEEIEGGDDEEGEGQSGRLLEDDLDVDQAVAGDGIGEDEGDEGLEQDRQLGARGRPSAGDERDDVEDRRREDAEGQPADDDAELLLEQDVGGPPRCWPPGGPA